MYGRQLVQINFSQLTQISLCQTRNIENKEDINTSPDTQEDLPLLVSPKTRTKWLIYQFGTSGNHTS